MVVLGVGTNPVFPSVQAVEMKFAQAKLHLDNEVGKPSYVTSRGYEGDTPDSGSDGDLAK
jgi:hypothetical protein